jgi:hypothetical protein
MPCPSACLMSLYPAQTVGGFGVCMPCGLRTHVVHGASHAKKESVAAKQPSPEASRLATSGPLIHSYCDMPSGPSKSLAYA